MAVPCAYRVDELCCDCSDSQLLLDHAFVGVAEGVALHRPDLGGCCQEGLGRVLTRRRFELWTSPLSGDTFGDQDQPCPMPQRVDAVARPLTEFTESLERVCSNCQIDCLTCLTTSPVGRTRT
jgi:hypothetical protein